MKEVMEMAMQELAQIAAAEEQARAICEQARAEAAELAVQAEKDGTARLNAVHWSRRQPAGPAQRRQ